MKPTPASVEPDRVDGFSPSGDRATVVRGALSAGFAYAIWGVLPFYWKGLAEVPALELVAHRVLWCALFLLLALAAAGRLGELASALRRPRALALHALAAALIATNWLVYVWAVNAGHIVETSLGYFINPLLSVLLGVFVLKERMRRWQWPALALAAAGVLIVGVDAGRPPWIALVLATAFALYGLVKKIAPLGSLPGLALETLLLAPVALIHLVLVGSQGCGAFLQGGLSRDALLVGTGLVTAVPLGLFGAGARRIPLVWTGLLQYIAPTLQFLIGVMAYGESFDGGRPLGFVLVWVALLIFAAEGLLTKRRPVRVAVAGGPTPGVPRG